MSGKATTAASVPVPVKPTPKDKLQYFVKRYYVQLLLASAILLVVWCKRTSCRSPICRKLPSFFKVCEQRPLPGGIPSAL